MHECAPLACYVQCLCRLTRAPLSFHVPMLSRLLQRPSPSSATRTSGPSTTSTFCASPASLRARPSHNPMRRPHTTQLRVPSQPRYGYEGLQGGIPSGGGGEGPDGGPGIRFSGFPGGFGGMGGGGGGFHHFSSGASVGTCAECACMVLHVWQLPDAAHVHVRVRIVDCRRRLQRVPVLLWWGWHGRHGWGRRR